MITLKIGAMPGGELRRISVPEGTTIATAIQRANLTSEGFTVSQNGEPVVNTARPVSDNDRIILTKEVKGN